MKAFMSDRDGRRQAADLPRLSWLTWAAEGEARAILSETEPESRCPDAVTTRYSLSELAHSVRHPGIAFTLPHDMQIALRDALEAFVGEGH